jgi:hypothetical protein
MAKIGSIVAFHILDYFINKNILPTLLNFSLVRLKVYTIVTQPYVYLTYAAY